MENVYNFFPRPPFRNANNSPQHLIFQPYEDFRTVIAEGNENL
jgi:hypothetical protein